MRHVLLTLVALAAVSAAGADPGSLTRDTALYQAPYADSASAAQLATGAAIDVQERQGGWYRVKTADGATGWVRMTTVRFAEKKNAGALSQVGGLLESGRSASTGATATTGVRGLDEHDLANAQPDAGALDAMASHQATPAAQFASALGLQAGNYPLKGDGK